MRGLEQPTHGGGRVGHDQPLADDQVGAAFEATGKLRHDARRIGEITLYQQHGVAARIARLRGHMSNQRVEGAGVADLRGPAEHGDGHRVGVLLRYLRRCVGARIIVHDDLVLARKFSEDGAEPPKQDADGGDLIVYGNGEVEHRNR